VSDRDPAEVARERREEIDGLLRKAQEREKGSKGSDFVLANNYRLRALCIHHGLGPVD
jgi:hypothetical protein